MWKMQSEIVNMLRAMKDKYSLSATDWAGCQMNFMFAMSVLDWTIEKRCRILISE
jgi:hypothetical protein